MTDSNHSSQPERMYYCPDCGDHYHGGEYCPDCGTEGELA